MPYHITTTGVVHIPARSAQGRLLRQDEMAKQVEPAKFYKIKELIEKSIIPYGEKNGATGWASYPVRTVRIKTLGDFLEQHWASHLETNHASEAVDRWLEEYDLETPETDTIRYLLEQDSDDFEDVKTWRDRPPPGYTEGPGFHARSVKKHKAGFNAIDYLYRVKDLGSGYYWHQTYYNTPLDGARLDFMKLLTSRRLGRKPRVDRIDNVLGAQLRGVLAVLEPGSVNGDIYFNETVDWSAHAIRRSAAVGAVELTTVWSPLQKVQLILSRGRQTVTINRSPLKHPGWLKATWLANMGPKIAKAAARF